jgi:PPOX class probable F420-dependent enzyme
MTNREKAFVQLARVAHLATADDKGRPQVIPICFALDGKELYSPIDEKPKTAAPLRLKRIRNIQANPHIAVVIDRYDENWQRLAYVLIKGRAKILMRGARHQRAVRLLRMKYPQYRKMRLEDRPIIRIIPTGYKCWGNL